MYMLFYSRAFWLAVLKISIKIGLFFFLTSCCNITPIAGITDYKQLYYGQFRQKSGKNKNKLRTIYPKNHEHVRNSKPTVQLYGSYKKTECSEFMISTNQYRLYEYT